METMMVDPIEVPGLQDMCGCAHLDLCLDPEKCSCVCHKPLSVEALPTLALLAQYNRELRG